MVRRTIVSCLGIVVLLGTAAAGHASAPDGSQLSRRYAPAVVQIRILNPASGSKTAIGSGFVVATDGRIATNFHVVSEVVHHPDRYRPELVLGDGSAAPLAILGVDVVHDLAILDAATAPAAPLVIDTGSIAHGTRMYAMGNPFDLGFTIVEGTYNGLIERSIYERIHFTGSINPGMSGGPAITAAGHVVGINVATKGQQVGFLVPAKYLARLLAETDPNRVPSSEELLASVRDQLLANQDAYVQQILATPAEELALGRYRLPTQLAPFMRCWGDTEHEPEWLYEVVRHGCSTEDDLYVSQHQRSGEIDYRHELVRARGLGMLRFFSLYEEHFASSAMDLQADIEDVTPFQCHSDFIDLHGMTMKGVFCLRAYRKLAGLYDVVLKGATLVERDAGVTTELIVSGVSFENAVRLARHYLGSVSWSD